MEPETTAAPSTPTAGTTTDPMVPTNPPFSWPAGQQNPFAAFQLPSSGGVPIVISPVFSQSIGDISAGGGPGSSFAPNPQTAPVFPVPTQAPPAMVVTPTDEKDLLLAESKEKLRSMKVMLKAAKESHDRERKIYESQLHVVDGQLDRERLEFNRERDSIVSRYEQALQSKDQAHQDTLDQLKTLQSYFNSHLGNGHRVEMDAPKNATAQRTPSNVRSRPRG